MNSASDDRISQVLHNISVHLSETLSVWLERPSVIAIDDLIRMPLVEAVSVLGGNEQPICCCTTELTGAMQGCLILAFDDANGLALAETVTGMPMGEKDGWTELKISAVLETANILGSAYLNTLSGFLSNDQTTVELLPAPPVFNREYPECLMQFALLGQATAGDTAVVNRTRIEIAGDGLHCILLFIPDSTSLDRLAATLPDSPHVVDQGEA